MILHDQIKASVSKTICNALSECFEQKLEIKDIYKMLGDAPNFKVGHLAFPCFSFAKILRMGPPQISNKLQEFIVDKIENSEIIKEVVAQGPYLNFFLKNSGVGSYAILPILNGDFFTKKITEDTPKTMIEYSQPNTHKELHVGHMRNAALGDALIRLHRYSGYDILAATYPGDMGTHVVKCLWYLNNVNKEDVPKERKGAWLGRMYSKSTKYIEEQKGTSQEEQIKKDMTAIFKEIESGKGEYYDLWRETREWSLDLMKDIYKWADISFDHWYFESDIDEASLKLVKKYQKKGLFKEDQGAVGIDLSDEKLGFCLLIKSDGHGLYATKDLELARQKFEDHNIEKSIYIVDKRQSLHFSQVFNVLGKMGFENAKNCYHLAYDFVELPEGAMSSRKGTVVALQDLVDEMTNMIKSMYLNRYEGDWSKEEIDLTAQIVALGAIRYGMLRVDANRIIVFDMKEWLRLDGESGPYIQYVYARIYSMCEKLGYSEKNIKNVNWDLLNHKAEIELLVKLSQFNQVVLSSCEQYKTHSLCSYLYDLGKLFNYFYAECSVGKAETSELKDARLALSKAVALTIEKGLNLLGIPAPKKM